MMATVRLDLGGEMESPLLENRAPDKSRSEGEHPPAFCPKYKTGRDTWAFPLSGHMRGCQSAELRLHD